MGDQNRTQSQVRHGAPSRIIAGVVLTLALTTSAALILRTPITTRAANFEAVAKTDRVVVGIEGMHCTACARGIKSMLKRTRGVVSAEVSFDQKEANVEFDPSATSREKILEAINNMGYKANVKG